MASKTIIVTGDKKLTKMLNAPGKKTAGRLHRTASRKGAKLILDSARQSVPRLTGAFAKSLTVRAMKRSRTRMGYIVTQRLNYAHKRNRTGTVTSDKDTGFYGVYQELGWRAVGRRRKSDDKFKIESTHPMAIARERETKSEIITTYRGKDFTIGQLREGTKVKGKWAMREAGKRNESAAIALYHAELNEMIDEEASK